MIKPTSELTRALAKYREVTGENMQFHWNEEKKVWNFFEYRDPDFKQIPWEDDEAAAANINDAEKAAVRYMLEIILPWATALHPKNEVHQ